MGKINQSAAHRPTASTLTITIKVTHTSVWNERYRTQLGKDNIWRHPRSHEERVLYGTWYLVYTKLIDGTEISTICGFRKFGDDTGI